MPDAFFHTMPAIDYTDRVYMLDSGAPREYD